MKVSKAAKVWLDYHRAHSKKNTLRAYEWVIDKFCQKFSGTNLTELSSDGVLDFVNLVTDANKLRTKRVRSSHLTAFFNFIKNNIDPDIG